VALITARLPAAYGSALHGFVEASLPSLIVPSMAARLRAGMQYAMRRCPSASSPPQAIDSGRACPPDISPANACLTQRTITLAHRVDKPLTRRQRRLTSCAVTGRERHPRLSRERSERTSPPAAGAALVIPAVLRADQRSWAGVTLSVLTSRQLQVCGATPRPLSADVGGTDCASHGVIRRVSDRWGHRSFLKPTGEFFDGCERLFN
jgi:hypothetical protein